MEQTTLCKPEANGRGLMNNLGVTKAVFCHANHYELTPATGKQLLELLFWTDAGRNANLSYAF